MKRQRKLMLMLAVVVVFMAAGLIHAADELDSALKDYVYPGSELGGQFSMGNTLSVQFTSQDKFIDVVNHYKKKFPDTNIGSGTSVYFGKQNPDGGDLTVTLTELDNGTQIILKLTKKP
jgi:hypothetical protein